MTLSTGQNILGISDAKIAKITTNNETTYACEDRIELPELSTLEVTVKKEEKECKAGFTLVDAFTLKTGYEVKFENVNIPLDVIALINGATLTQTGTTPSQINKLIEKSSDIPAEFNLAFKTDYLNGDAADFHMELFCVKGLIDVVSKADDYWNCSFTGTAFARKKDKAFRGFETHETATEIASTVSGS